MIHATIDTVSADLNAGSNGVFRATGSTVTEPGFMAVYLEGSDDAEQESKMLPPLGPQQKIKLEADPQRNSTLLNHRRVIRKQAW